MRSLNHQLLEPRPTLWSSFSAKIIPTFLRITYFTQFKLGPYSFFSQRKPFYTVFAISQKSEFLSNMHSGLGQPFENRICYSIGIGFHWFLWVCQVADDFPLPRAGDFPITQEGCQNLLMAQVLAPYLKLLRGLTDLLTNRARVFLKLCGLKYGSPAAMKAFLNIVRMGEAVLQCFRSKPAASKCCEAPTAIRVAGKR